MKKGYAAMRGAEPNHESSDSETNAYIAIEEGSKRQRMTDKARVRKSPESERFNRHSTY